MLVAGFPMFAGLGFGSARRGVARAMTSSLRLRGRIRDPQLLEHLVLAGLIILQINHIPLHKI